MLPKEMSDVFSCGKHD